MKKIEMSAGGGLHVESEDLPQHVKYLIPKINFSCHKKYCSSLYS